jgi:hypothetical protein
VVVAARWLAEKRDKPEFGPPLSYPIINQD